MAATSASASPPAAAAEQAVYGLSFTDGRAWALHERRMAATLRRVPLAQFDARQWPAAARHRARYQWTALSYGEYRAASTLAYLTHLLVLAGAPLDITSLASTLPQQELAHAELCARVALACGGAVDLPARASDFAALAPPTPGLTLRQQATELVVRHCCVAETLSFNLLLHAQQATTVPLLRDALRALARDEALHSELGWLYLDWCCDNLDDAERARLGRVAAATAQQCRHAAPPAAADVADVADAADASSVGAGTARAHANPAGGSESVVVPATGEPTPLDWLTLPTAAAVDTRTLAALVAPALAEYGIAMVPEPAASAVSSPTAA